MRPPLPMPAVGPVPAEPLTEPPVPLLPPVVLPPVPLLPPVALPPVPLPPVPAVFDVPALPALALPPVPPESSSSPPQAAKSAAPVKQKIKPNLEIFMGVPWDVGTSRPVKQAVATR